MTAATPTARTIHQLRKHDGPLFVANNTANLVTCRGEVDDKKVNFELYPKGHPKSMMTLPKAALEMRGLQELWVRGDITVSADEEMEDQIALLINQNVRAPEDRLAGIMSRSGEQPPVLAESSSSAAMVEKPCLQCGHTDPRSGVIDRGRVIQSLRDVKDGVAPLCSAHTALATQYTPRLVMDTKGEQSWEFDKVMITPPIKEKN